MKLMVSNIRVVSQYIFRSLLQFHMVCADLKDAYLISLDANYFIDATRKGSFARFINHSW